ncbi:hypothetical protein Syun_023321 [Stephania yunnanensis]|uniref:Uncharacterized protein n=1 Tax=Stephania yunnanensis TaxID=152371 RepID=A0AAP0I3E2_9MAGN
MAALPGSNVVRGRLVGGWGFGGRGERDGETRERELRATEQRRRYQLDYQLALLNRAVMILEPNGREDRVIRAAQQDSTLPGLDQGLMEGLIQGQSSRQMEVAPTQLDMRARVSSLREGMEEETEG